MHLKGKDWRRFRGERAAPKVSERPSYNNFRKVIQNRHFLKKCKGGTKGNFQKSSQKYPSFERPKSTLAQRALSRNWYALKVQRLEKILTQKAAPKMPEWQRYGNFWKVTLGPHFLKKCKGGTKKNFSKIAQKVAFVWKAQKHTGANGNIV